MLVRQARPWALPLCLLAALFLVSLQLEAKAPPKATAPSKGWHTYWNGPRRHASPALPALDPAVTVPPDPSAYAWALSSARLTARDNKPGGIPVYKYDETTHGKLIINGQQTDGLAVQVTGLFARQGIHFYEVQSLTASSESERFWVAGYYLKATPKK